MMKLLEERRTKKYIKNFYRINGLKKLRPKEE